MKIKILDFKNRYDSEAKNNAELFQRFWERNYYKEKCFFNRYLPTYLLKEIWIWQPWYSRILPSRADPRAWECAKPSTHVHHLYTPSNCSNHRPLVSNLDKHISYKIVVTLVIRILLDSGDTMMLYHHICSAFGCTTRRLCFRLEGIKRCSVVRRQIKQPEW